MGLKKKCIRLCRYLLIKNKNVTIISNNCWGGFMYQSCGLKYQSPFIGLFIWAPDYILLLEHFDDFIFGDSHMKFIDRVQSKYSESIREEYPIGVLINDKYGKVEIHFLHYHTEKECLNNWYRRVRRINKENMIVKFCDRDQATPELIGRFDSLPYRFKVCFTAKEYPFKSTCCIAEFKDCDVVENEWEVSDRYWDFVEHANRMLTE